MNPKVSRKHGDDLLRVYLTEYEFITEEVLKRIESKQRLLVYKILLIGIVITAGMTIMQLDRHQDNNYSNNINNTTVNTNYNDLINSDYDNSFILCIYYFLLISPLPFYYLSREYLRNIYRILKSAQYMSTLRTEIKSVIDGNNNTAQASSLNILGYFYFDKREEKICNFIDDELRDISIQFGDHPSTINKFLKMFPTFISFPLILIVLFTTTFTLTYNFKHENILNFCTFTIIVLLLLNAVLFKSALNMKIKINREFKKN
jgi:hypothetical protein